MPSSPLPLLQAASGHSLHPVKRSGGPWKAGARDQDFCWCFPEPAAALRSGNTPIRAVRTWRQRGGRWPGPWVLKPSLVWLRMQAYSRPLVACGVLFQAPYPGGVRRFLIELVRSFTAVEREPQAVFAAVRNLAHRLGPGGARICFEGNHRYIFRPAHRNGIYFVSSSRPVFLFRLGTLD
jgi:hypothetical protein